MRLKDPKRLWQSFGWNGKFDNFANKTDIPSDLAFKEYFENLLNAQKHQPLYVPATDMYVPVLDDDITVEEVDNHVSKLKVSRWCSPRTDQILACPVDCSYHSVI